MLCQLADARGLLSRHHSAQMGKDASDRQNYWTCSECGEWSWQHHKKCFGCGATHAAEHVARDERSASPRKRNRRKRRSKSNSADREDDDKEMAPPSSLEEARRCLQDLENIPARTRALLPSFDADYEQACALVERLRDDARTARSLPDQLRQAQTEARKARQELDEAQEKEALAETRLQECQGNVARATARKTQAQAALQEISLAVAAGEGGAAHSGAMGGDRVRALLADPSLSVRERQLATTVLACVGVAVDAQPPVQASPFAPPARGTPAPSPFAPPMVAQSPFYRGTPAQAQAASAGRDAGPILQSPPAGSGGQQQAQQAAMPNAALTAHAASIAVPADAVDTQQAQPVQFQSPFLAPGAAASSGAQAGALAQPQQQAEAPANTVAIQAPQLFVLGSTAPQTTLLEHRESMSDDVWHESSSEAADDASSVSRHSRRQQFAERQRLAQAARETKKISTFFRPSADPAASRRAVADAHQAAIEAGAAASAT